jgi:hypothetical protein
MRSALPALLLLLGACTATGGALIDDASNDTSDTDQVNGDDTGDTGETEEPALDPMDLPVLLVHGVNGAAENYDVMVENLVAAGWPREAVYAYTFDDPSWGCNLDNAFSISEWVEDILAETEQPRINLVAHSMGTLSSRYFVKNLGGTALVNTYATLGGMHHGLESSCSPDFPFKPCIWTEICTTGEFVTQLNEPPSTPGDLHWVSIYGTADESIPNWSSHLDGAENIVMPGVEHYGPNGLLEDAATFAEVKRVLQYSTW